MTALVDVRLSVALPSADQPAALKMALDALTVRELVARLMEGDLVDVEVVVRPTPPDASPHAPAKQATYRYRDPDKWREYMREYMKRRRATQKEAR